MKLLLILLSTLLFAKNYSSKTIFGEKIKVSTLTIVDTISENPINTKINKIFSDSGELIGYSRPIITTTGCNSACLPIEATLIYDAQKKFDKVVSLKGLTKKDHIPLSKKEMKQLNFLLSLNPYQFATVTHPKQMVDALSGATLKEYEDVVVKNAAYTTLRLNRYNQDTLKHLGNISSKD